MILRSRQLHQQSSVESSCHQRSQSRLLLDCRHKCIQTNVPLYHGDILPLNRSSTNDGSTEVTEESAKPEPEAWWKKIRVPTVDKAKLAALGFGAFCAYGVISNVNAGVLITIAWLTVVRTTGAMPISPGMWPKFLAIYAGLWVTSHFMRPIRLSLAIAAAPFFDRGINNVMTWTKINNKVVAFSIMLLFIAMGTISFLLLTIFLCGGFIF
ncbi:hypothetical protein CEUSTIGMA_g10812.t1 [Chlamydomonas eustigma]|uniref:Uncharacterized protein n=1 Tax=Chlamydomonas eustigma TaxID=1157962 RepID=A0A250XJY9_9CHLO|nr:hypothetical protein CEUSTIGMA_g10812.t1 [Chlamydomonas eustigma]|eukprot:GAX83387.1 hypothetical protein CEUSTIGMA_g10812.t1 [Chlamydomonas eustigma]